MHKKNLLVCLQSYFRKALAFKQPQYFEGFKLLCNWLSVNFQIQNGRRRQKSQTQHQCCIVTVNFAAAVCRFQNVCCGGFQQARPIFAASFCRSFISAAALVVLHRLSLLALLSSQDREEEKMGKKHYSKQWCGVTQQTHEKEQGIKMHFPLLVRRKKSSAKILF